MCKKIWSKLNCRPAVSWKSAQLSWLYLRALLISEMLCKCLKMHNSGGFYQFQHALCLDALWVHLLEDDELVCGWVRESEQKRLTGASWPHSGSDGQWAREEPWTWQETHLNLFYTKYSPQENKDWQSDKLLLLLLLLLLLSHFSRVRLCVTP